MDAPAEDPGAEPADDGSNQAPERDEPQSGRHQVAMTIMVTLMLTLITIAFSQTLAQYTVLNADRSTPWMILMLYMLVGKAIIMHAMNFPSRMVIPKKEQGNPTIVVDSNPGRSTSASILRKKLSLVGMTFFLPFACVLEISHMVANACCFEVWETCGGKVLEDHWIDMFFRLFRLLFMCFEFVFCVHFHGFKFQRTTFVRCNLMILLAVNVCLWFSSLVYETTERGNSSGVEHGWLVLDSEAERICNETLLEELKWDWGSCLNTTNRVYEVQAKMARYLYPFTIEFLLLVGEFLLECFFSSARAEQKERHGGTEAGRENAGIPFGNIAEANPANARDDAALLNPGPEISHRWVHLLSRLIACIGALTCLVSLVLAFTFDPDSILFISQLSRELDATQIEYYFSICEYVLTIVLLVVGFYCGSYFEKREQRLRSIDWLVLMSVFGPFMFELLNITALSLNVPLINGELKENLTLLAISTSINIVMFILQGPFLFYADRCIFPNDREISPRLFAMKKILKAILIVMAISNLVNWMIDSIVLENTLPVSDKVLELLFQEKVPQFISVLFKPLVVFYRFGSFLLFVRTYLGH